MNRALAMLMFTLVACEGFIDNRLVPPSPKTEVPSFSGPPLVARVRRLTPSEYQQTVAALLGSSSALMPSFPADPAPNGYGTRADSLRVSSALVQALWDTAPKLAPNIAARLLQSPGCSTTGAAAEGCARTVLSGFAKKAYRRSPEPDEVSELLAVYTVGAAGADFSAGITLAVEAALQSASLLYRTELGENGQLTSDEAASAMSYMLTGGPPDDELSALASKGALTAEVRAQQARRLLATPEARAVLGSFAIQWLQASNVITQAKDEKVYPQWSTVRTLAVDETRAFVARAVLDENADLSMLLTAQWTVGDAQLAAFYGGQLGSDGKIVLPQGTRSGVLTHASVLASHAQLLDSSPTKRGHMVRTRLLCQLKRLAPPQNLKISLPAPDPKSTTRQRFSNHTADPSCSGCHTYMDPIGFGFEHYDATGSFRSADNGQPVDSTGTLVGTDVDGRFTDAVAMGTQLGASAEARDCFAQNWFEYAMGESVDDNAAAEAGVKVAAAGFIEGHETVKDQIVDLVKADLFVSRAPQH